MSATYPSSSFESGSAPSASGALCLSLSGSRKRYSFDNRERIKRRKQLNPIKLPIVTVEEEPQITFLHEQDKHKPNADQHITNLRRYVPFSGFPSVSAPSFILKNETETSSAISDQTTLAEEDCDSVPLNLTMNREKKTEPTKFFLPHKDELGMQPKSESPVYDQFIDKKDQSPPPAHRPSTSVTRNLFTNTRTTCRIFNPEAFCNICNKEFCNKYFLKTHKANKHGVYSENKESSLSNDVELPPVPLTLTWNLKNNNAKVPIPNPYSFTNTVKDSSAFCNICEKEFCNKYFLRRHKEKMHRILPTVNENKRPDQGSEKCEDDERPSQEGNFTYELNSKLEKKRLKLAPCDSNDAVSEFIKICINNKVVKEEKQDSETAKKESVDFNNISNMVGEKHAATAEFRVHANDEYFGNDSPNTAASTCSVEEYQCEYCKKSFSTQSVRKLHQKYVHAYSAEEEDIDDGEFRQIEDIYFMILKFSWLNTTVTYCEICNADFEKNDVLELHLMNKHGSLVDELSRIIEDAGVNGLSAPSLPVGDGSILCQVCSNTFTSNAAFQQHVYERCSYPDINSDTSVDAESDSNATRNFCQICKKELCNKYFMKTHMRRMHGIAIQNGVRIGGVTCEICNKELCSKYFLRVHKKNCHGISESNTFVKLMAMADNEKPEISQTCAICGRLFKSIKWLKTHLFNDHSRLGAGVSKDALISFKAESTSDMINESSDGVIMQSQLKDERDISSQVYQCSKCQFQAPSVDLLLAHQKLHIKPLDLFPYRCIYCFIVTKDKLSLEEHIAYHHLGSGDFQKANEFTTRYDVTSDSPGSLNTKNHFYSISNAS